MAETTGLVQQLSVLSKTETCVWIGPTSNNATLLVVTNDGSASGLAFSQSLVHALATAATNYRQVTASHGGSASSITTLRIDPV
jgi:hypothetical protein